MNTMNMKDCKICHSVTPNARYVKAIQGWRCGDCDIVETGTHNVTAIQELALEDLNPLDDQPLRQTVRRHLDHLESL